MTDKPRKIEPPLKLNMGFEEAVQRFAQTKPSEVSASIGEKESPLSLIEDDTGDRFLIYTTEAGNQVDLQVSGDTFWAAQQQIADAFGVTRQNISLHLLNIFKEGELDESAVCKESLRTGRDGKRYVTKLYDLNALISVGYRVGGKLGTSFRIWASDKLVRYLTKGFVVDAARLKNPGEHDRVAELRDIIRDIRASEANVYAELRRICALCQDYDPRSEGSREFYSHMQAKLYWATVSQTPSMVIVDRADAREPNMGLRTWSKQDICKVDVVVAKNYLEDTELRELNRLTTILLDVFEDQLEIGRLTLMSEARGLLDVQLKNLNRVVLRGGGTVSHVKAEAHAQAEYRKFDDHRRLRRAERTQRELAELKAAQADLPKPRRGRPPKAK